MDIAQRVDEKNGSFFVFFVDDWKNLLTILSI